MNLTITALSAMGLSFFVVVVFTAWYVISFVQNAKNLRDAVTPLLWLHVPRYIALLLPSVQASGLPITDGTRDQIVAGDLLGMLLALLTLAALRYSWRAARMLGWIFVVTTLIDIANAAVLGLRERLFDHATGWAWFILTFYVPMLCISAVVIGWQLWARRGDGVRDSKTVSFRSLCALLVLVVLAGCTTFKRFMIAGEIRAGVRAMQPPGPDTELTDLGGGIFTYRWLVYRTAFVTTPDGVILFEPLNSDAVEDLIQRLPEVTPNPLIRYVIYTHHHEDHIGGGKAIPGNPTFVAHANTARDIAAWTHPDVAPPTVVFEEDQYEIQLGDKLVRLHRLPRGHTDGNVLVHLPSQGAVFASDLVFPRSVPPVGMPFTSFHGVLESMRFIQTLDYHTFVPSHGLVGTREDVDNYARFLKESEQALRRALVNLGIQLPHGNRVLYQEPRFAEVIFAAMDALRLHWGHLVAFEEQGFPALQWVFFQAVMMNE